MEVTFKIESPEDVLQCLEDIIADHQPRVDAFIEWAWEKWATRVIIDDRNSDWNKLPTQRQLSIILEFYIEQEGWNWI